MDKELRSRVRLTNPEHFLALGFGSGLLPKMPGTYGSIAAIPLILALGYFSNQIFLIVTVISIVVGFRICGKTAKDLGVHDHGSIVWDEIAGMLVTFILVPISWWTVLLGFALFRLFDIAKPWPISLFDKKVHGGVGIMMDDLIAGLIACGCVHAILLILNQF